MAEAVNEIIRSTVEKDTNIYSDEHGAYYYLGSEGFNAAGTRQTVSCSESAPTRNQS